jgi:hypothetical protein
LAEWRYGGCTGRLDGCRRYGSRRCRQKRASVHCYLPRSAHEFDTIINGANIGRPSCATDKANVNRVSALPLLYEREQPHWSIHNSRQPDREGRAAARLALDRHITAHHLAEAFTDREPRPVPPYLRVVEASACGNS